MAAVESVALKTADAALSFDGVSVDTLAENLSEGDKVAIRADALNAEELSALTDGQREALGVPMTPPRSRRLIWTFLQKIIGLRACKAAKNRVKWKPGR